MTAVERSCRGLPGAPSAGRSGGLREARPLDRPCGPWRDGRSEARCDGL